MKLLPLLILLLPLINFAQITEDFEVEIESFTIPEAPGIHSFSWGIDSLGRWLIVGGRLDGLHQRQPFAAFLANDNNKNVFVIDPINEQVWSTSLDVLSVPIFEQLQSTNQEFFQRGNQLYVIGGYGYSPSIGDHITYAYLTAIDVNGLTNAVINENAITSYFRQISNSNFAVTGGQIGYMDSTFYLAGGQYFEGRYNPMGPNNGPGFIQEYTEAIRKFKLSDNGSNLSILDYSEDIDTDNLHRRDYNMAAQVFPNGESGFTIFSGVFQKDVNLPFLNTVDVTASGHTVNNNFNQYLSQYHSPHLPVYDVNANTMHTLFFGGMSQFTMDENGNLVEDQDVPFVKTISKVSRFSNGDMEELKLDIEMPTLVGSGAEFIPATDEFYNDQDILNINELPQERTHIGYIYGGIESSQENIFFINNGGQSIASNVIFKIYINKPTTVIKEIPTTINNIFHLNIFPVPVNRQVIINYNNPTPDEITIRLSSLNGQYVSTIFQGFVPQGNQNISLELSDLSSGVYFISIENKEHKDIKTIVID